MPSYGVPGVPPVARVPAIALPPPPDSGPTEVRPPGGVVDGGVEMGGGVGAGVGGGADTACGFAALPNSGKKNEPLAP